MPQKVTVGRSPLTLITLLIALIAVGLAAWALIGGPGESSAGGGALPGDPTTRVCVAAHTVSTAVQLQTNANIGPEPAAVEAVAGNARLAMLGGGEYLLSQIDADTPADLAEAARSFGATLQVIGVNALAGVSNDEQGQSGRIREAEAARNKLSQLCA